MHNLSDLKADLTLFFESRYFLYLSHCITLCQLLILCCDYHGLKPRQREILYILEFFVFWLYFGEFLFRWYIRGSFKKLIFPQDEKHTKSFNEGETFFNVMDLILIVLNIVEFLVRAFSGINVVTQITVYGKIVTPLKALRIFRVLFFLQILEPLNFMIEAFVKTFMQIGTYIYIIIVFILIMAFIG